MYWPGYPIKSLHSGIYTYVKIIGHEMSNKITTITRVTLSVKGNFGVKQTDFYSCFDHWQMLQHAFPYLCG